MTDCLFCKLVRNEIPRYVVYEDDEYLAFLTPFPNTPGLTIVIPKKHYPSNAFQLDNGEYSKLLLCVKKIALLLEQKLQVSRCALVFEGTGVNHVHAKVYPLYGPKASQTNVWSDFTEFAKEYRGYITTVEGPQMSAEELKKIQSKIVS